MEIATRNTWKTKYISENIINISLPIEFTKLQFNSLKIGLIPRQMEDKWFAFYEDSWLYFHRSWTGFCIFKVRIEHLDDNKYITTEIWVERDGSIYKNTSEENDKHLIQNLLQYLANRKINDFEER